ncbi:glycosyltransferase family 39 protein [Chloroflexota bacterium]
MDSEPALRFTKTDFVFLAILLAIATAIRLPYLQLIPVITDEVFEVLAAQRISQGELIIFGPMNPTAGPLVTYLIALGFWVFGSQIHTPRIIIMVLGVLTVGLTYLLGRSLGGRRAGLIAGALLAFSPIHTVVNSHVAWSNAATPFFITLTFLVLHAAVRRRSGWLLVLGGLSYGLALQTHVSMLVVIPGLVLWFLLRKDILSWLRQPWPYLAAFAALLGYSNMIAFNLLTRGGSLENVQQHTYAWVSEPTWAVYWTNVRNMVAAIGMSIGGQLPRVDDPLGSVIAGLLLVWLVASLIYALWRGETLPALVMLSSVLVMPYFNKRYEGLLSQRYIAFLLPLCFAAMGWAAAHIAHLWRPKQPTIRRGVAVGLTALAILLAIYPAQATLSHYTSETRAGRTNEAAIYMAGELEEAVLSDTPVYISFELAGDPASGGRRFRRSLAYYLMLEGVSHEVLELPELARRLKDIPSQGAWLVLTTEGHRSLAQDFRVERGPVGPPAPNGAHLARYVPVAEKP